MKSTILFFSMVSAWKLVMRKEISYPWDRISISFRQQRGMIGLTGTGLRRRTTKLSALCIINRVNLWQSNRSTSSACFILILSRMELIDGSMRTRSFSFREMVRGFKRASFDTLGFRSNKETSHSRSLRTYPTSTSGLLCRSTT